MDSEVSKTLAELEQKLHELEVAIDSAPHREQTGEPMSPAAGGTARLVDEGIEHQSGAGPLPSRSQMEVLHEPLPAESEYVPAPPEPEAQSGAADPPEVNDSRPGLTGESIELAELVRFRERLDHTMRELIDEYSRIIMLRRPGQD